MHLMKVAALALATTLMQAAPEERNEKLTLGERVTQTYDRAKDRIKNALAPILVLLSDDSKEAQLKRLQYAHRIAHPIRRVKWVLTGHMPVKNPDGRVSDAEYVEDYVHYKALIKWNESEQELTDEEVIAAREEALEVLEAFRNAKGIRVRR